MGLRRIVVSVRGSFEKRRERCTRFSRHCRVQGALEGAVEALEFAIPLRVVRGCISMAHSSTVALQLDKTTEER